MLASAFGASHLRTLSLFPYLAASLVQEPDYSAFTWNTMIVQAPVIFITTPIAQYQQVGIGYTGIKDKRRAHHESAGT
ncbi:hypothetical protein A9A89_2136 [Bifidobacterium psychraerophilum DSM 22366]|nr:hypothetical protein [Bifidobacterium psychraerophilum]PKA95856.1 hypothetical protein A9A89_2136 [Bifidobacterium psychraerophilum DSM 22366]